jgi:hypothetical protein
MPGTLGDGLQHSRSVDTVGSARALITFSTSAVAVCRSQRLLGLVEEANVLDRDHRLVGEGLEQLTCFSGNAPTSASRHADRADDLPLAEHGHAQQAAITRLLRAGPGGIVGILEHVRDQHRSASRTARGDHGVIAGRQRIRRVDRRHLLRRRAMEGGDVDQSAVEPSHRAHHRVAQLHDRLAIASKTGWTSVGDSLMTRRMSAVAVWCARASWVSLNRRTFSIAITAWSAKVSAARSGAA